MVMAFTHIALHVRDIEAAAAFYAAFCGLTEVHRRADGAGGRVVWLAEPGKDPSFVVVLLSGGRRAPQAADDYSHLGFACDSRDEVDRLANTAAAAGCLVWPPRDEPFPVGYYCGVADPDGNIIEFSYGQPLGPGAAASLQQSGPAASRPALDPP